MKETVIGAVLEYASLCEGLGYSRKRRYDIFPGGSADCSSFVYACFLAAGIQLRFNGRAALVSYKQVYADDFDLVFPKNRCKIGRPGYWGRSGMYKTFGFMPGDLIFYCTDIHTKRKNMITHVALCCDGAHIIHDGNDREKTCIKDISYGDGCILAVLRLKDDIREMKPKTVFPLSFGANTARAQLLLNTAGARLKVTGFASVGTTIAIISFNRKNFGKISAALDITGWKLLMKNLSR